jgi:hypothetical protein
MYASNSRMEMSSIQKVLGFHGDAGESLASTWSRTTQCLGISLESQHWQSRRIF